MTNKAKACLVHQFSRIFLSGCMLILFSVRLLDWLNLNRSIYGDIFTITIPSQKKASSTRSQEQKVWCPSIHSWLLVTSNYLKSFMKIIWKIIDYVSQQCLNGSMHWLADRTLDWFSHVSDYLSQRQTQGLTHWISCNTKFSWQNTNLIHTHTSVIRQKALVWEISFCETLV